MPANKPNKPFTNYKNILEVDYKNPTQIRLFMYDVEDGHYSDDFFSINNINPNRPQDLIIFINVLDRADRLQSRFATSEIRIKTPGSKVDTILPAPDVRYNATCIVRDYDGKKLVKETVEGADGYPIRHYQIEDIKPGVYMAKMKSIITNLNGRPTPTEVTSFSVKPGAELGKGEIKYYHKGRFNPMADVNPTFSFHLKQQIRQAIAFDTSKHQIREFISIQLVELQKEERDGNGNIIKPLIPPIRQENIVVNYNFETGELELAPETYKLIADSASQAGASPQYNMRSAAMLEIEAYLAGMGDNAGADDVAKKAAELVRELARTGNTSKTFNEKGEEISNKK